MIEAENINNWNIAISRLRKLVESHDDEKDLLELATLQSRLQDNLTTETHHGTSENLRHDRSQILHALNRLALKYSRQFLTDLILSKDTQTSTLVPWQPFIFVPETSPKFQGRASELKWLNDRFSKVTTEVEGFSTSQSVLIRGDIGIGKGRLINSFGDSLLKREIANVVIRTFSNELAPDQMIAQLAVDAFYQYKDLSSSSISTEVVTKMLSGLIQGRASTLADLGQNVPNDILLWRLIGELALQRPLVIILENLQAAHPRLFDFFKMTVQQPLRAPVLIIGILQTAQKEWMKVPLLPLRGLEKTEMRALVDELCYPSSLNLEFYDRLYQRTEGNPYFTIEIINYLKHQRPPILLQDSHGQWYFRADLAKWPRWTPENLIDFAREQLNLLKKQNKQAGEDLEMAAVIGPRFLLRVLQYLANYSDDEREMLKESLEAMESQKLLNREEPYQGMIEHDITYNFRSPIIQEALYKWDPKLHLKVADLLGELYPEEEDQERLRFWRAFHYQKGGNKQAAIQFLRASIKDVAVKRQPFESIWLHEHILKFASYLEKSERLDLNRNLAKLYSEVGRYNDAFKAYECVVEIADENNERAVFIETKAEMGWLRVKQERFEEAEKLFEEAIARLKRSFHPLIVLVSQISKHFSPLPGYLPAFVYRLYGGLFLERLIVRARGEERKNDGDRALFYTRKAGEHLEKCNLSDPDRKRDKALVLNNIGRFLLEGAQYKKARKFFQLALQVTQGGATEQQGLEAYLFNNLGVVDAGLEQLDKARQNFQEALKITDREENIFLRTKTLLNLAEVCGRMKEYEELIPFATEGLWYANLLKHRTYQCDGLCTLGKGYFKLGKLAESRSLFEQARDLQTGNPVPDQWLNRIDNYKEEDNG